MKKLLFIGLALCLAFPASAQADAAPFDFATVFSFAQKEGLTPNNRGVVEIRLEERTYFYGSGLYVTAVPDSANPAFDRLYLHQGDELAFSILRKDGYRELRAGNTTDSYYKLLNLEARIMLCTTRIQALENSKMVFKD